MKRYDVEITVSEEGFSVCCPSLPGCWSQGATEEEARANIQSAIEDYLAAVAEVGKRAGVHGREPEDGTERQG